MTSAHDYHIASEPDFSNKVNRHIWYYFIVLALMLIATSVGLIIMYRFQVQYEREIKIGEVDTKESLEQVALSQSYLSGTRGLVEGKRHVAVDTAMKRFINDARKAD